MPLIIDAGRVPSHWAERENSREVLSSDSRALRTQSLNLALINNMPDAALEATEMQFFELLDIASGSVPVVIKLYSLSGVPRTDRGQRHINNFYYDFDDLWNSQLDGMIVTGTEPHHPNLQDEPYWKLLTEVLDWAERNTCSTILSCLAAHASVLHSDRVGRHRLRDKQFGVFESAKSHDHALVNRIGDRMQFPHSRWNEVREEELTCAGYLILTKSVDAGVDLFVKQKRKSLFVHAQGHPEYGAHTLMKEYRRDVKRFLNYERETYPSMPAGYFVASAARILRDFQQSAMANRREEMMSFFPEKEIIGGLRNEWRLTATALYRSWLDYLGARKIETSPFVPASGRIGSKTDEW